MALVVCRMQPSVRKAYEATREEFPVTLTALYAKLHGVEVTGFSPHVDLCLADPRDGLELDHAMLASEGPMQAAKIEWMKRVGRGAPHLVCSRRGRARLGPAAPLR
jgi:hypothetical protein